MILKITSENRWLGQVWLELLYMPEEPHMWSVHEDPDQKWTSNIFWDAASPLNTFIKLPSGVIQLRENPTNFQDPHTTLILWQGEGGWVPPHGEGRLYRPKNPVFLEEGSRFLRWQVSGRDITASDDPFVWS